MKIHLDIHFYLSIYIFSASTTFLSALMPLPRRNPCRSTLQTVDNAAEQRKMSKPEMLNAMVL